MDLYKVRIFPFEPMAEKQITISYSQLMEYAGTALELNIPLTVRKYETRTIDDFEITVTVSNKNGLKTLYSPDLQIISVHTDEFNGSSKFTAKAFKPESDFRLYIGTSDQTLGLDLMTYKTETSGYFFMNISPGFVPANAKHVPKDVTFILDVSGSMSGQKIEQARNALKFCVENLNNADYFEIIRFSTEAKALFESKQIANKENKTKALAFIENITAIGGTNMSDAFKLGFPAGEKSTRPHSVIFITDGKPTIG
ncbi:MAG TPA: trypsin, partial [Bacteroidales bacterium]|nr:trypsin [Bacteroidales bacterium]